MLTAPLQSVATCGGGGTSALPLPAATFLRSYRAAFNAPTRIAADASGTLYVTDPVKGEVVVRAANGRILSRGRSLGYPVSVAVDGAGRIYVGDGASGGITAFTADWQPLFMLGQGAGEFLFPNDIAVDPVTGELYVTDSKAHLVKVYSPSGVFARSFGGQGRDDGQLNFPAGIFVDATAREVVVVDQLNFRVEIFDVDGNFLSCFGAQGSGAGKFNVPQGVWVDAQGRIYVADSFEGRIQVLDRNGSFVGFIGDFGEGRGQLRVPTDMVVDASNRLFVTSANNARVEVFGLDAFNDPESIVPAEAAVQPDPLDRARSEAVIVAYVEVPGYSLSQVVTDTIVANGVATSSTSGSIGDHDENGIPDLRVEFEGAALLATLPDEGSAAIAVSGTIGGKQFEASSVIQVIRTGGCGPDSACSLRGADPQCNEAVCVEPIGCVVQPKAGASCDDGNACTIGDACSTGVCAAGTQADCDDGNVCTDDACDPAAGCVHANNTAACDDGSACTTADACREGACVGGPSLGCDDGNGCTDDGCDPAAGCVHVNNAVPCGDGNACTTGDTCSGGACAGGPPLICDDGNACTDDACEPASGCVHAGNAAPCDDHDPGTAGDMCDGAGRCVGRPLAGNYAVLRWPAVPPAAVALRLGWRARVRGTVCVDVVDADAFSRIDGDAVAAESAGRAITFDHANRVAGSVVTGGGSIRGLAKVRVSGRVDTTGAAMELDECFAASYRAATRWADLAELPTSPGLDLGAIEVERWASRRIALGGGRVVIDATGIRLNTFATLTLVGDRATEEVIVRVRDATLGMAIGHSSRIETDGLAPERVIFVVDGPVSAKPRATLAGTVFTASSIRLGRASTVNGAVVGGTDIRLDAYATVDGHPFVGW